MDAKDISTGIPYLRPVSERYSWKPGASPLEPLTYDPSQGDPKTSSLPLSIPFRTHGSKNISTEILWPESERPKPIVLCCAGTTLQAHRLHDVFLESEFYEVFVFDDPSETMLPPWIYSLQLGCNPVEQQFEPQRTFIRFKSDYLSNREVDERYNQGLCCLFNMFHNHEIVAKKLDAALKSLEQKYYYSGTDCCRSIHRGDMAGTSLSRPSSLEGGGVPVGIGLVNNNGDPSSSVKHSPPGKGKVPHEEGAGGFANVSGDATGSMNAPCEGDLEMGRVNNNGDPPAPGDVPLSVVPRVAHTADRSSEYGVNVARTVFRVSAAAASRTTTSDFAKASYAIGLADSGAAILLADTHWKAATPILAKAGIVACAVGVLADMGKDLPLPLFMVAIIAAIFIIIAAMVFAKRLT